MNKKVILAISLALLIILIIVFGYFIYRKNAGIIISRPKEAIETENTEKAEESTEFEPITLPRVENYVSNDVEVYN